MFEISGQAKSVSKSTVCSISIKEAGTILQPDQRIEACVLCGLRITVDEILLSVPISGQKSAIRTYFAHPACLKKFALPTFAGIDDL